MRKLILSSFLFAGCAAPQQQVLPPDAPPSEKIVQMVKACGSLQKAECPHDYNTLGKNHCYASTAKTTRSNACFAALLPLPGPTQLALQQYGCDILRIAGPAADERISLVIDCRKPVEFFN